MAPRPNWKGFLKLSLVSCSIALYPATSSGERVSFNQINKNTGNRIKYRKVDADSGDEVESPDIVKGYQVDKGVYVTVDDDELEALQVDSNHTIEIDKFVPLDQIDERFFDSPYYVVPNDNVGQDAFAVIREAMRSKGIVGLGRVVISKRERPIVLVPDDKGLRGMTLRYPYEVREKAEYFSDIPEVKIPKDMLQLAEHIVESKTGTFEPKELVDHYENAVIDLIKTKQAGKPVPKGAAAAKPSNVVNLMDALRRSISHEPAPLPKPAARRAAATAKATAKRSPVRARKTG